LVLFGSAIGFPSTSFDVVVVMVARVATPAALALGAAPLPQEQLRPQPWETGAQRAGRGD
jgi:hypothetical protein